MVCESASPERHVHGADFAVRHAEDADAVAIIDKDHETSIRSDESYDTSHTEAIDRLVA